MKMNQISRRQVAEALSPIWTTKPETARCVRQRIRAIMDRAVALEYVDYNPAGDAINGALLRQRGVKKHHRALPYRDLPASLRTVRGSSTSPPAEFGFEMLALTACRSGEVRGMTWDEVDLREATWTLPGERMKAGKPRRVPSLGALAILKEAPCVTEMVSSLPLPAPAESSPTWLSTSFLGDWTWTSFLTGSAPASGTGRRRRPALPTLLWRRSWRRRWTTPPRLIHVNHFVRCVNYSGRSDSWSV